MPAANYSMSMTTLPYSYQISFFESEKKFRGACNYI